MALVDYIASVSREGEGRGIRLSVSGAVDKYKNDIYDFRQFRFNFL